MIHELKCERRFFTKVSEGKKTFEIRKNDRNFQVGDYLALNETAREDGEDYYTGNSLVARVGYILDDEAYVPKGYVVMSITLAKVSCGSELLVTQMANLRPIRREK